MRAYIFFAALLRFGARASTDSCSEACTELQTILPAGSIASAPESQAYWAAQVQAIQAACYVKPGNNQQVATVISTASKHSCQFAVRGAGHSDVIGASNLANGIVLDLADFTDVTLSSDKTFAVVGAGNQWGNVYTTLDKLGYTVVGGRETTVGVGGLSLGGGVSYFSGKYGFTCDNVLAYEVVLANGTAATVSQTSDPDLYRALRGGGNNFAVVTRFHLAAYKYDALQGGLTIWSDSAATQASQVAAFTYFAKHGAQSPDAAMFLSLSYIEVAPIWIDGLYYASPSPPIPAVEAYKPFFNAQLNSSRLASTQRSGKHADFASELGLTQPHGLREQFHTGTYVADAELLNEIVNIFRDVVAKSQAKLLNVLGGNSPLELFTPTLSFQPLTQNILQAQKKRGGNVLGLDPNGPPLMLLAMSWAWRMPQNDDVFNGGMAEIVRRSDEAAARMGLSNKFIYMNYASTGREVIQSYGPANVRFMKAVSRKYDADQVFQNLVPGGFKIPN